MAAPDQELTQWMERYVDGDIRGFEEIYQVLAPLVLRCQRRWIGNQSLAEDLTQETFLRVHRSRARYHRGAPVAPWVLTIARRLSIDALRSRGAAKVKLTAEGELPERFELPDASADDPEHIIAAVREAVAELPEAQRQVVAMHKLEGISMREIAHAMGISEQAARLKAHRGYNKLRVKLASLIGRPVD